MTRPRSVRAAYQGSCGAFSEDAARAVLSGIGADPSGSVPCERFEDVFDAVRTGLVELGVVPVENTLAGSVQPTYDLLLERRLTIVDEHVHRIEHCLIAPPGVQVDALERVLSHPVALAQCRRFFAGRPDLRPVLAHDTAGAVEMIMKAPPGADAAIASRRSAELYGAAVLTEHLEDDPANFTRFLVIARSGSERGGGRTRLQGRPHEPSKTSLVLTLTNRPGSLVSALQHFARRGVDLTMIESRPRHGRPFEYTFSIDLAGAVDEPAVVAALADLAGEALDVHVLGSYPRAAPVPEQLARQAAEPAA